MRRLVLASALLLASCGAPPPPKPAAPAVITPAPVERGSLIGLGETELLRRLGPAALTVREGDSVKLQFRGTCVLDAYLYPDGGQMRVRHVDTRLPNGIETPQAPCLAALAKPL